MDGNTELIDKLVSKKALDDFAKLDAQIQGTFAEIGNLLKKVQELNVELSKAGTTCAALTAAVEKVTKVEQQAIDLNEQQAKSLQQIEKLRQQEEKTAQQCLKTREEEIRLALLQEKSNRTLMSDAEKRAKKEAELSEKINIQVKSIQDLMTKNNALNQVRKNLDLTTAKGREEYIKLTKAIKENEEQLKKFDEEIGRHQRNVGNYQSSLGGLGKKLLGFFGIASATQVLTATVGKIKDFVSESMKMAATAEGISTAFDKMNRPGLLDNLRKETKGLLNDVDLMKAAVQAKNFNIPVENLGKLLKFAQQRAQETGQSVDYLTNSIIMGLGRKSPLILDNLGISAIKLRERAKESGDFMKSAIEIVNEELEKQGDLVITSADKGVQASVKWENAQLKVGQRLMGLKNTWNKISSSMADFITDLATKTVTAENAIKNFNKEAENQERKLNNIFDAYKKANEGTEEKTRLLDLIKTKYGEYISDLIDEKGRITDIDLAQKQANQSLRESLALKLKSESINKIQEKNIKEQRSLFGKIRERLSNQPQLEGIEDEIIQGMSDILKKVDTAGSKEEIDAVFAELDKYIKDKGVKSAEEARRVVVGNIEKADYFAIFLERLKENAKDTKNELEKIDLSFSPFISKEAQEEADKEKEMRKAFNEMTKKELDEYLKINKDAKDKYIEIAKATREIRFGGESEGESEKQKREREKKEREAAQKRQAEIQTEIENLKTLAAEQGAIYLNDKNSYDQRLAALQTYYAYAAAIREEELKKEKAGYQVSTEQIEAINASGKRKEVEELNKHNAEVEKITEDHFNKLYKKNKESIDNIEELYLKGQEEALVDLSKKYKEEMKLAGGDDNKRAETEKKYQAERKKIIYDTNMAILNDQLAYLESQLPVFAKNADMQKKIQEQIAKTKREIEKETADYAIEQNENAVSEMTTLEEEFNKFMSDKRTQAVMGMWEQILDITNQYYDQQLRAIDDAEARDNEYYENKLKNIESEALSEEEAAARKRIIEEEQMQKEKQYERQRKEIQKKQAVWQKANAIIQATINTAQAATAAYSVPVVGIALAATIAALGAAQIAIIAGQKIPEYKEGTRLKDHPGGLAYVGDGGRPEMAILPGGEIWKTPDKKTLVDLPAGTEVLPDFKKAFENIACRPLMIYRRDEGRGEPVVLHDDVQRNLLKNSNKKLDGIYRSIGAIRKNTMYSNSRQFVENWIKNY